MDLIAARLNRISPSQTIAISAHARALKAAGRDVISLSAGEPDFDTPDNIKDAARRAIAANDTRYTDVGGTPALKRAIIDKFQRDSGLDYRSDEIIVSTGAKQVIFNALLATLEPGDEVVIPAPGWVSYPDIVSLADGTPVIVPCGPNASFKLRAEQLEDAITPRTKWLILNSPNNPTGSAYTADDLRPLCDVLLAHPQVWVMADDIYEKLVYDGIKAVTVAQIEPRLRDRTLTLNGVSKAYAMTGWRIGYAGAPAALTRAMDKLQSQSTSSPSSISQAAAVEALSGPQDSVAAMARVYQARRDLVVGALNRMPGITCHQPDGAFYVYPSMQGVIGKRSPSGTVIETDEQFAVALLEAEGVATVHGSAFMFPGHFRISYALDTPSLERACDRIARFCRSLS